ncbi:MAG: hypothetical protein H7Y01_03895 [Ferruginibacter sp.]|nr:hypothetical protein [Chitinophagaceae bacterium]
MSRTFYRHLLFLLLLFPFTQFNLTAQNLTGIWRGYFITEDFARYKFELQVKQTGTTVSGVSYSYLSTVFYGKATLTGNFNKTGQSALIREIKTVELRMSGGSQACIMKCIFNYDRSGKEEFLEGTFTSKFEKDGYGARQGGDCGGGKVYLRKVTTSDFYIEPFLRGKIKTVPVIINQPPLKKDTVKTRPSTPPVKKPVVVNPPISKPVVKTTTPPVTKPKVDTTKTKVNIPPVVINPPVITAKPAVLKNRSNELMKTLTVSNTEVTVKLYDNGEIDDDTISVYLDNKLVLSSKRLTAAPLTIKFTIDDDDADHELTMVAENLGRIPPNTSLMIVESGEQRFDVRITSTQQKNAVVRFKYQKPK